MQLQVVIMLFERTIEMTITKVIILDTSQNTWVAMDRISCNELSLKQ